jgi:zinc protease
MKTIVLAVALVAAAFGQGTTRRQPPPPNRPMEPVPAAAKPKPFAVPPRETFKLANGLQVSMVQYGDAPLVSMAVVVQAGVLNEAPGQDALASLTADLMKEGAGSRSGQQLAEEASSMGGSLAVFAGSDTSTARIGVLSEFAAPAMRLLADVVQKPTLPDSEFPRIQAALLRNLAVGKSRPAFLAEDGLARAMFPAGHPYARAFPDEAMVKKHTAEDVRKFHASQYGAARSRIYVVGKFDRVQVKQAIEQAFSGWKRGPELARNVPKMEAKRQVVIVERPNSEQAVVRFAVPIPLDPTQADYIPMQVADSLLGGSFISRITTNIREEKGYTYSPGSSIRNNYKSAFWAHNSEIANKYAAPAIQEILKEVNRLRAEPPSEEELGRIKAEMAGTFVIRNANNNGVLQQLAYVDAQGLTDDYLRTYVTKVQAVSRADIQRLAETYLNPAKMTYVVVGETSKIQAAVDLLQAPVK